MKKDFVPYELALRLKELGFNENCLEYYDSETKDFCDVMKEIPAPLFSQAFRWFRENHNLCGYVRRGIKTVHENMKSNGFDVRNYEYSINTTDGEFIQMLSMENTYEEAELDCLEKLIEIVENK